MTTNVVDRETLEDNIVQILKAMEQEEDNICLGSCDEQLENENEE